MPWLTILKLLLEAAAAVSRTVHDNQLMSAGEARAVARQMADISARLGIAAEISAAVDAMSEDQLAAELRGD